MAEDVEEAEDGGGEEECPKCPPVGAPAWMATFADMATLLMAFFVLILSFAEFNTPKFKQISGSLKNAFGVQKKIPVVEQPKGTTVISLEFSPSPSPSVTETMTQQTTDDTKPEVEVKTDDPSTPSDSSEKGGQSPDQQQGDSSSTQTAQGLADALKQAIANGDVSVESMGDNVVINFPEAEPNPQDMQQLVQQTLQAIKDARAAGEQGEVLFSGMEDVLSQLAEASQSASDAQSQIQAEAAQQAAAKQAAAETTASAAKDQLQVALQQEVAQGLVTVERRDGKVFVTVGAGGAFPSGTADLTAQAADIMNRIAFTAMGSDSTIKVTGHTDDVPISNGLFRDNWDLAAARAASVVQAIQATGLVEPDRMSATSKGEMAPVASNDTPEGRERNRRIEIEIDYQ